MFRALLELALAYRQSRKPWQPQSAHLGRDRRQFQRVPVRVACRMNNRIYGLEAAGTLVNLSLGGAGFLAPVKWPEGSHIRVFLDEFRFEVNAVVVFRGDGEADYLYGVKFERLGFKAVLKLQKVLRRYYQGSLTL